MSTAQTNNIVSIGNLTISPDDSAILPIKIINATGVAATNIKLSYDPGVVIVTNATFGDFTKFLKFDNNNSKNGWVRINTFITGTQLTGNVTIANITLNAVEGSGESPLNLSIISLNDHDGDTIIASTLNGTVKISPVETVTQGTRVPEIPTSTVVLTAKNDRKTTPGFGSFLFIFTVGVIYIFTIHKTLK